MSTSYTLISGATKGIGRALAEEAAKNGRNIALLGRTDSLLESTAQELSSRYKVNARILPGDLAVAGGAKAVFDWINDIEIEISALIHNAGFGVYGKFAESDITDQLKMVHLHIQFQMELTHLLLPMLKKQSNAHIMFVSSNAAFQATPYFSTYAATKAFQYVFARGIRAELKGSSVNVTCLSPGPTDSSFADSAGFSNSAMDALKISCSQVANEGFKGMLQRKALVVPGAKAKLTKLMFDYGPTEWIADAVADLFSSGNKK